MNKLIVPAVAGLVLLAVVGLWYFSVPRSPYNLDAFARCLRDKGVTMYGASWCPHCQNEKTRFGGSFHYVPYVECPLRPEECVAHGVNAYPTWIFKDGRRLEGDLPLETLGEASGCPLSANSQ